MKRATILAAVLVGLSFSASAQTPNEVQQLLNNVSQAYRGLTSYHFERRTVTESKTELASLTSETKSEHLTVLAAIKPDKQRVEAFWPQYGVLSVYDGKTGWTYVPSLDQYVKEQAPTTLPQVFKGAIQSARQMFSSYEYLPRRLRRARLVGDEAVDVAGKQIACRVVEAELDSSREDIERPRVRVWIDKSTHLVVKESESFKRKSPYGSVYASRVTHTFTIARVNQSIPESLFKFEPPNGAKEVAELIIPGLQPPTPPRVAVPSANMVGKAAVDFALKDLDGKQITLSSLRGKVILINFWASWCGPCRIEMPHIEKLHREFKDKGLVVLGIDNESPEVAREYLHKNGFTFTSLVDDRQEIGDKYGISAIPQVYVVGRDGTVVAHYIGARSEDELRATVNKAGIGEKPVTAAGPSPQSTPPVIFRAPSQLSPPVLPVTHQGVAYKIESGGEVPALLFPKPGDVLENGLIGGSKEHVWEFKWTECSEATLYHLYVIGLGAIIPLIDRDDIQNTSYRRVFQDGYVADGNNLRWRWKVRAKIGGVWREWSQPGTFNVRSFSASGRLDDGIPPALSAPTLIAPANATVFTHYPRQTVLQWQEVPGALSYKVEIEFYDRGSGKWTGSRIVNNVDASYCVFNFVGAQPSRWRVWAVTPTGSEGPKSAWREFRYTR